MPGVGSKPLSREPANQEPVTREFSAGALRRRRLRITFFFARVGIHFLWWDYILRRPLLRVFRTPWVPRWQRLTGSYKELALDLQGLWIKLGQFLSTRVDVLPMEITQQLDSLRDEVPPVSTAVIIEQIEAGLGLPIAEVFASISPRPVGSASLAQVHRAQTIAGEDVVVKVLRPGIRETIAAGHEAAPEDILPAQSGETQSPSAPISMPSSRNSIPSPKTSWIYGSKLSMRSYSRKTSPATQGWRRPASITARVPPASLPWRTSPIFASTTLPP